MKKLSVTLIYLPCLFLLFIIESCKKNSITLPDTSLLVGSWELRQTTGGNIKGSGYAPGNGNKYVFTSTNFQEYTNNQLTATGTYNLVKTGTLVNIIFNNQSNVTAVITISNNVLSLHPIGADVQTSIYVKL